MVDLNMLMYFQNGVISGWKEWPEWVDEDCRLGRRVYMLIFAADIVIRIVGDLGFTIPDCFQILKYQPKLSEDKLQKVLGDVVSALNVDCDRLSWRCMGTLQIDI